MDNAETFKQEFVLTAEDLEKKAKSAATEIAMEEMKEEATVRVKTYFFKNNKKLLKAVGICLVGASIQILHKKTKTQGSKIELLNLENQFLHFVISGLSNPDVDATEFNKEIARRANYVQIVSAL